VGNNCFIGSNCNVVAPVCVADNSYVCAGTTLTVDTNEDDFVIGRCRETIKAKRAHNYLKETK
jgi:bifunctional UDP-N-acetylglucosamine pyrophosphorylase/glucosamine-1-phosphate N-acetyltransferase